MSDTSSLKDQQTTSSSITPVSKNNNVCKSQLNLDDISSTRRSSSRSIKRKKFDDEVVESSILLPKAQRNKAFPSSLSPALMPMNSLTPVNNNLNNNSSKSQINQTDNFFQSINSPLPIANSNDSMPSTPTPIKQSNEVLQKKPKPITTTTKRRRYRNAHNNAVRDLGRWKPQDDLALVIAVQQINDLEKVYRAVKFSCKFTLKEIENRWFGLLYDPTIAKIGVAAMRQLHPDVVAQIHANAPFNEEEENLLKSILSNSHPKYETFKNLLQKNINIFLPYRRVKELKSHWTLLKHYHLLNDQSLKPLSKHEEILNFSDAEQQIENDLNIMLNSNSSHSLSNSSLFKQEDLINQELALNNRKTKREIRQLENEIPKWQVLVDSITGVAPSDFDNETLAVLRGRLVRYLMRSREITLGRCTKDSLVDVDLSLEGPSGKISRKQALIKLNSNGDFLITNTGKRAFIVDSKPVLGNVSSVKLYNNSVLEIAGLRFVFLINQDLIANVRVETLKNI